MINYVGIDSKVVFVVNFIVIILLAGLLSFVTEEIVLYVRGSLREFLNTSFEYVLLLLLCGFLIRYGIA